MADRPIPRSDDDDTPPSGTPNGNGGDHSRPRRRERFRDLDDRSLIEDAVVGSQLTFDRAESIEQKVDALITSDRDRIADTRAIRVELARQGARLDEVLEVVEAHGAGIMELVAAKRAADKRDAERSKREAAERKRAEDVERERLEQALQEARERRERERVASERDAEQARREARSSQNEDVLTEYSRAMMQVAADKARAELEREKVRAVHDAEKLALERDAARAELEEDKARRAAAWRAVKTGAAIGTPILAAGAAALIALLQNC